MLDYQEEAFSYIHNSGFPQNAAFEMCELRRCVTEMFAQLMEP